MSDDGSVSDSSGSGGASYEPYEREDFGGRSLYCTNGHKVRSMAERWQYAPEEYFWEEELDARGLTLQQRKEGTDFEPCYRFRRGDGSPDASSDSDEDSEGPYLSDDYGGRSLYLYNGVKVELWRERYWYAPDEYLWEDELEERGLTKRARAVGENFTPNSYDP